MRVLLCLLTSVIIVFGNDKWSDEAFEYFERVGSIVKMHTLEADQVLELSPLTSPAAFPKDSTTTNIPSTSFTNLKEKLEAKAPYAVEKVDATKEEPKVDLESTDKSELEENDDATEIESDSESNSESDKKDETGDLSSSGSSSEEES